MIFSETTQKLFSISSIHMSAQSARPGSNGIVSCSGIKNCVATSIQSERKGGGTEPTKNSSKSVATARKTFTLNWIGSAITLGAKPTPTTSLLLTSRSGASIISSASNMKSLTIS